MLHPGEFWLGMNPDGSCDHDVDVLRIDNASGEPVSVMVNWAAHAVINWRNPKLYSGDWPGAASKYIEEAFQNEITVQFTIGASGDVNPSILPRIRLNLKRRILVKKVLKLTETLQLQ